MELLIEHSPAVDGKFWRGVLFGVPASLAIWLLIVYAVLITFC